jgi:hypothetical protein
MGGEMNDYFRNEYQRTINRKPWAPGKIISDEGEAHFPRFPLTVGVAAATSMTIHKMMEKQK